MGRNPALPPPEASHRLNVPTRRDNSTRLSALLRLFGPRVALTTGPGITLKASTRQDASGTLKTSFLSGWPQGVRSPHRQAGPLAPLIVHDFSKMPASIERVRAETGRVAQGMDGNGGPETGTAVCLVTPKGLPRPPTSFVNPRPGPRCIPPLWHGLPPDQLRQLPERPGRNIGGGSGTNIRALGPCSILGHVGSTGQATKDFRIERTRLHHRGDQHQHGRVPDPQWVRGERAAPSWTLARGPAGDRSAKGAPPRMRPDEMGHCSSRCRRRTSAASPVEVRNGRSSVRQVSSRTGPASGPDPAPPGKRWRNGPGTGALAARGSHRAAARRILRYLGESDPGFETCGGCDACTQFACPRWQFVCL